MFRDLQYSCEGYMALALAQYNELFELVSGYLYGARGVCSELDIVWPLSVSV